MGEYEFGDIEMRVGGFFGMGGKSYIVFIDVSDEKVLSIVEI